MKNNTNLVERIPYAIYNGIMVGNLPDLLNYIREQGHTYQYVVKAELQSTPNTIKFTQMNNGVESVVNFAVDLSAYYTISDIDSMLTGYVKTTTDQEISGKKQFNGITVFNNDVYGNNYGLSFSALSSTSSGFSVYSPTHSLYPNQIRLNVNTGTANDSVLACKQDNTMTYGIGNTNMLIADLTNNRFSWGAWDIVTGELTAQTRDTLYAATRGTYKVTEFTRIKFTTAESPTGTTKAFTCKMITGLATAVTLIATEYGGTGTVEYRCIKDSTGWGDWTTTPSGTVDGIMTWGNMKLYPKTITSATVADLYDMVTDGTTIIFPQIKFTASESPNGSDTTAFVVTLFRATANWGYIKCECIGTSDYKKNKSSGTWSSWLSQTWS